MAQKESPFNPKTGLHRFWILAVSLIITSGTAISPALPMMQADFANEPNTLVNMVATIQQVPAFIVLLFSSQIASRFGIKKTIGVGMLLMGIAGVLPAALHSLWLILAARIVFGIGIGLTNSLAITLVDLYYSGDDQTRMLGNRSAFEPIGLSIVNLLAGFLLNFSWQAAFLAYAVIFVVLFGFWKVVPEYHLEKQDPANKTGLGLKAIAFLVTAGITCACFTIGMTIISVLTPDIVVDKGLGDGTTASLIITAFTIAGMAMGFLFGALADRLGGLLLAVGAAMMAIGAWAVNSADNLWQLTLGAIVIGCAFPLAGTFLFSLVDKYLPQDRDALGNSILLVGCNVGTAMAPATITALNDLDHMPGLNPGITVYAWLMTAFALLALVLLLLIRRRQRQL
ncbi:MFS transporter [Leuconostocaceae bacterium ESL0958]|nr:MFS transporter [Leuconostocaceae bacterium ESL0958]